MSEERLVSGAEEFASTATRATLLWTSVCQTLLVAAVVLWVLDVPRRVFGVALYTEQLLAVCLGLGLAIAFIAETASPRALFDWMGGAATAGPRRRSREPCC